MSGKNAPVQVYNSMNFDSKISMIYIERYHYVLIVRYH